MIDVSEGVRGACPLLELCRIRFIRKGSRRAHLWSVKILKLPSHLPMRTSQMKNVKAHNWYP